MNLRPVIPRALLFERPVIPREVLNVYLPWFQGRVIGPLREERKAGAIALVFPKIEIFGAPARKKPVPGSDQPRKGPDGRSRVPCAVGSTCGTAAGCLRHPQPFF
jgi:hypothetical protein